MTRKDDPIDLCDSDNDKKLPEVIDINDNSSDGKVSGHNDSNPGNDDDNKKMPAV